MIVDASALISIIFEEQEGREFAATLKTAESRLMAAPTYLEVCMVVIGRKGSSSRADIDRLIAAIGISIVPFNGSAAQLAVEAFIKYGKGRHPARLNFGDCISYAMSKTEVMPLLFKGDDFHLTDVEAAI